MTSVDVVVDDVLVETTKRKLEKLKELVQAIENDSHVQSDENHMEQTP